MKTKNYYFATSLFLMIFFQMNLFSQSFQIGHRQVTYTDPGRSNRSIQTEFYYPATVGGANVDIATGQFPIIVFGHGFVMAWSSYQNFWDSIVPNGYIMAFPRTEGNMSPNHEEFGKDLAFLVAKIKNENVNTASFLSGKVAGTSAIMGHSMGGGASFLAAQNNGDISAMVSFAAANTTPSSITAAAQIHVPVLIFSGENDGVAPPAQHQQPMYDSLSTDCKTFISILGGGHCSFANYNFNCSFGEGTTSPQPTISGTVQQQITFDLLLPYLDYILKNNSASGIEFQSKLTGLSTISYQKNCNQSFNISGNITYHNSLATPLSNVIIELTDNVSLFTSTTTNVNGEFSFNNIANGNYSITASTNKAWGGLTSTDALKMKRHIAGLEILTDLLKLKCADVNMSSSITSTDVLKVQRRIAGLDSSFPLSDWLFSIANTGGNSVTVNGANVNINLKGICAGDVNGSHTPAP